MEPFVLLVDQFELVKDVLGNHLMDRLFHLVHWLSFSPYNCEGPVKNPSIWKESLTWIFLDTHCTR